MRVCMIASVHSVPQAHMLYEYLTSLEDTPNTVYAFKLCVMQGTIISLFYKHSLPITINCLHLGIYF